MTSQLAVLLLSAIAVQPEQCHVQVQVAHLVALLVVTSLHAAIIQAQAQVVVQAAGVAEASAAEVVVAEVSAVVAAAVAEAEASAVVVAADVDTNQ